MAVALIFNPLMLSICICCCIIMRFPVGSRHALCVCVCVSKFSFKLTNLPFWTTSVSDHQVYLLLVALWGGWMYFWASIRKHVISHLRLQAHHSLHAQSYVAHLKCPRLHKSRKNKHGGMRFVHLPSGWSWPTTVLPSACARTESLMPASAATGLVRCHVRCCCCSHTTISNCFCLFTTNVMRSTGPPGGWCRFN